MALLSTLGCANVPEEDPFEAAVERLAAGDYRGAIDRLEPLAVAGDFQAQALIGRAELRLGAYDKGLYWLSLASRSGDQLALLSLADIYLEGQRVPRDFIIAANYYRRVVAAGRQGYGDKVLGYAYARLGFLLGNGYGMAANPRRAVTYFREAATLGSSLGMLGTGMAYEEGLGYGRDRQRADVWLDLAVGQDQPKLSKRRIERTITEIRRNRQNNAQARRRAASGPDPRRIVPELRGLVVKIVGLGAVLNQEGAVLTNYQTVADCAAIRLRLAPGSPIMRPFATDPDLDLAVLISVWSPPGTINLRRRWRVRSGEEATLASFPVDRLISVGPAVSLGRLTPIKDREAGEVLEVVVPVEVAGGAGLLIDDNGHLVGLVTHWVSTDVWRDDDSLGEATARAVTTETIARFLDRNRIAYRSEPYRLTPPRNATEKAIGKATVLVECWSKPPAQPRRPPARTD